MRRRKKEDEGEGEGAELHIEPEVLIGNLEVHSHLEHHRKSTD